jgi:hypothetical protein
MRTIGMILCALLSLSTFINGQGKIELKQFDSTHCRIDAKKLRMKISNCNDIDVAEKLLWRECAFTKNSTYKLYCKDCPVSKMMRFGPVDKTSGTITMNEKSILGTQKGDYKIYTLLELRQILVDSILIFDSLKLDLSPMSNADKNRAKTIFFKTEGSFQKIYPEVSADGQFIVISASKFSSSTISGKPLRAIYIDDGEEKKLPQLLYIFFTTAIEKEALTNHAKELKDCNSSIFSTPTGLEYLETLLLSKYKKVDKQGLFNWLKNLKL